MNLLLRAVRARVGDADLEMRTPLTCAGFLQYQQSAQ